MQDIYAVWDGRFLMGVRAKAALAALTSTTTLTFTFAGPAQAQEDLQAPALHATSTSTGYGGAVSTEDRYATQTGIDVLRRGGNAVDAAVAAAATLGVTEPFSAGIGGGGFFVYYDAASRAVHTIDGREAAPQLTRPDAFIDPKTHKPYDFDEARVSGLSVGVPGTPATWEDALHRWGTLPLGRVLGPAISLADKGFLVDETFVDQIEENADVFGRFHSSQRLFLPSGRPPVVGSQFRNPDLANTYRLMAREGASAMYRGKVARDIVRTVEHPPISTQPTGTWAFPIRPGTMTTLDLSSYAVRHPRPTHSTFRGLDVYGMAAPSSGGTAVGEALNIIDQLRVPSMSDVDTLHHYLEASALAFADRNRYVGDGTSRPVINELLSPEFAQKRACHVHAHRVLAKPVAPGILGSPIDTCATGTAGSPNVQGTHTTNLTVADRWGNVVEYTLTIEQTGGNGMVVPGRGFLLNNELTDFNFTPTQGEAHDPNLPGPGKRPRSSMSPTIVLRDGKPFLAVGTPGGSTIITTVLGILVNRIERGMSLHQAVAAPRATQRNTAITLAEPAFADSPEGRMLSGLGHTFSVGESIGGATGIEFLPHGRLQAVAEPVRRGGGAAATVFPMG